MDWSHHLSEDLPTFYDSENIKIFDRLIEEKTSISIMPDLRYLRIDSLELSLSFLQNLEFLRVKFVDSIPTYLLKMPKLRHLHVGSSYDPPSFQKKYYSSDISRISSLQTLCYVFIGDSKSEEILRCLPNLRKLKFSFSHDFCPNLNSLTQLESLTMAYVSIFKCDYSVINFPMNIKKLTLSKLALPWKKMSLIGTLPNLEILKLDEAFEGKIWNTEEDEFQKLKFLQLQWSDVEQWNSSHDHFPVLERLLLFDCKKLDMIRSEFSNIPTLQKIVAYFCGKNVESSALQIREEQLENSNEDFEVTIIN